jgi:hypothetical protein
VLCVMYAKGEARKVSRAHGRILHDSDDGQGFDRAVGELQFEHVANSYVHMQDRVTLEDYFAFIGIGLAFQRRKQVDFVAFKIIKGHHVEDSPLGQRQARARGC